MFLSGESTLQIAVLLDRWRHNSSPSQIKLKVDEIDKTCETQTEKHNPITGERDDDTHGHRTEGHPKSMNAW